MRKKNLTALIIGSALTMIAGCTSAQVNYIQAPAESDVALAKVSQTEGEADAAGIGSTQGLDLSGSEGAVVLADAGTMIIDDGMVPLYSKPAGSAIKVPLASGSVTYGNNLVTIDASNVSQGYVMVKYLGSVSKIKVQITKSGSDTYTYDLNARSEYEVFPLTEGNGTYSVKVFENLQGNQYTQAYSKDISVNLADQFSPFLYPNQYVNFTAGSAVVQKGAELAASAADQVGVVNNVFNYVVDNFTYDNAKANSVTSGYLPNVDKVMAEKKGICFDYAAVMTSMLRSQDIPTKLVVGYTGSLYHAWVTIYLDNIGWVDNAIYFDGQSWKLMDPTFASSSHKSQEIMDYMKDSSNYQAKYTY